MGSGQWTCCASPNCTGTCGFFYTSCFQGEWTIPFTHSREWVIPIIVSEPLSNRLEIWMLIAKSFFFSSIRAHPYGSRCSEKSFYGFPAV